MINLSTKDKDLLAEMEADYKKAIYWHKKQHGGEKRYEKMRDGLLDKAMLYRKDFSTDVTEYLSPNGNRWRVFETARYFRDVNVAHIMPTAFVYYETYGSCGAFVPYFYGTGKDERMSCTIFTSHFFERFCKRLKIEYRSSMMITKFLELLPAATLMPRDTFRNGKREISIALLGSIGNGVIRNEELGVNEIRSYLTNVQLTNKQYRESERLRKAAALNTFEPECVKMAKMQKYGFEKTMNEEIDRLVTLGHDRELVTICININTIIMTTLLNLGYIKNGDGKSGKDWGESTKVEVLEASYRLSHPKEFPFLNASLEFLLILEKGRSKNLHLHIDTDKVMKQILTEYWQMTEEQADVCLVGLNNTQNSIKGIQYH